MSDEKKPEQTDRLMSREEYEQFDMLVQVEKLTNMLILLAGRIDKLETTVYGKQRHNTSKD